MSRRSAHYIVDPAIPFQLPGKHLYRTTHRSRTLVKVLVIGILVPDVTNKAPGGPIPSLEVLSCERHQAVGDLWGDNFDVLFGNIPYASVLDSRNPILAMVKCYVRWVSVAYRTW